ncbi:MAG: O-antigen ligase family protein, partial [Kiritimatiellae bacterium]|nr:O-antigen ligase family protein [Kiritimatiellia bacterium]
MIVFLSRYAVALCVTLFVLWSSWARGGSSIYYVWALPWISLLTLEAMFTLPPRHFGESARSAMRHFLRRMVRDPVLYFGAALLVFLLIQWLNGPRELEWIAADSEWRFADPPLPGLPSCVDQDGARQVLLWFTATVVATLAVRNATIQPAKLLILRTFSINGALLAVLGLAQAAWSPDKLFWYRPMAVQFFSTFGYPNHAGAFFVLTSAVNMGLLIRAMGGIDEENHPILYSVTLVLNILAAYFSLCRAAIVLETALIVFGLIYGCLYLAPRIRFAGIAKIISSAIVIFGCLAFMAYRNTDFSREVGTLNHDNLSQVYDNDRALLADIAVKIWQDNPWPGVGGWGFKDHIALYIPKEQWKMLESAGRANVHNDLLQFLCEHGAIGGGLMFAI